MRRSSLCEDFLTVEGVLTPGEDTTHPDNRIRTAQRQSAGARSGAPPHRSPAAAMPFARRE